MKRDMSEPEQLDLLDWLAAQPPCPAPIAPEVASVPAATSPAPSVLTRVDHSCNMRRFYSLALATSLFGECGLVRQWGRIGTAGQSRTDWYEQDALAERARQKLLGQKQRRGYAPIRTS